MYGTEKAPFYVIDSRREIIVGRFYKLDSAKEVQSLLREHAISESSVRIEDSSKGSMADYYAKQYRKIDEAGLQAILDEKYLPEPKGAVWGGAFTEGAVYQVPEGMFVATRRESHGRKWVTWIMVNLADYRTWKFKRAVHCEAQKRLRMATPNEWARAQGKTLARDEAIKQRKDTNSDRIRELDIGVGDKIIVQYTDGRQEEKVIAINYEAGRVAIERPTWSRHEKRRFIDAKHIVKVSEKSPYPRRNPINDPMWMR